MEKVENDKVSSDKIGDVSRVKCGATLISIMKSEDAAECLKGYLRTSSLDMLSFYPIGDGSVMNPLFAALRAKSPADCLAVLLGSCSDVSNDGISFLVDERGRSLIAAIFEDCNGDEDSLASVISVLSSHVQVRDVQGRTALHRAVEMRQAKLAVAALSSEAANAQDFLFGRSPLHQLVSSKSFLGQLGKEEEAAWRLYNTLLEQTDLNMRSWKTQEAVIHRLVTRSPPLSVFEALLASGKCDINLPNRTGETALIMALEACDQELAIFLMGAGSDLFRRNCFGETAMHIAAKKNQLLALAHMLCGRAVCPIHSPDIEGNTPLHVAAARGFLAAIVALLRYNSESAGEVNNEGKTAADLAAEGGFTAAVGVIHGLYNRRNDRWKNYDELSNVQENIRVF